MTTKLVSDREGDHVHTRVYMGEDEDHLALCGALNFRVGEWQLFGTALGLGAKQMMGHLEILRNEEQVLALPTDPPLAPMVMDALRAVAEERRIHRSLAETIDGLRKVSEDRMADALQFGVEGVDSYDGGRCRLCDQLAGGDRKHRCWAQSAQVAS